MPEENCGAVSSIIGRGQYQKTLKMTTMSLKCDEIKAEFGPMGVIHVTLSDDIL